MHHVQTRTSHFFHHNILVPENPVLFLKGERGQGTDLRALCTLTTAVLTAAFAVLGTEPRASCVLDRRPKTEPHSPPSSAALNSYPQHPRSNETSSCGACSVLRSAPPTPLSAAQLTSGRSPCLGYCCILVSHFHTVDTALSGLSTPLPSAATV